MCKAPPLKTSRNLALGNPHSCINRSFTSFHSRTFICHSAGKLDGNNRWVRMAEAIPWHEAELLYARKFPSKTGASALTVRMALGSLIIKEKLCLIDQETVEQIKENPYLQYFIGLEHYHYEAPFDSSLLTHFGKRFKHTDLATLQEQLRLQGIERKKKQKETDDDDSTSLANKGRLLVDATCWWSANCIANSLR